MVFPQKVNWFILYQSADKMASIFLGLAHAAIFWGFWRINTPKHPPSLKLWRIKASGLNVDSRLRGNDRKNGGVMTPPYQCSDTHHRSQIATSAFGLLAMTGSRITTFRDLRYASRGGEEEKSSVNKQKK